MSDDDVLAALEEMTDFELQDPDEVIDVTTLSDYDLSCLNRDTREELISRGEMLATPEQQSEIGKELHSIFLATQIELTNRRNRST